MFADIGLPSGAVDRVFNFIDSIIAMFQTLIEALLEVGWTLFVIVFTELAPVVGFALILCFWLYMFYTRFLEEELTR